MKRRDLIGLAGGAAYVCASGAWAQPVRPRRLALVHSGIPANRLTETGGTFWIRRFHEELRALGHGEGGNLVIERFSAQGNSARFAAVAADVAGSRPDIIVANSNPLVKALMEANPSTPVVAIMGDPILAGLVQTIARPGGSLTGVSVDGGPGIAGKRLQILKEAVLGASKIVYLVSAGSEQMRARVAVPHKVLPDVSEAQLRRTFAEMAEDRTGAVVVSEDGSYLALRALLVALAAQHLIPAIYAYCEFAEAGGLLAYGPELGDLAKRMANDVHLVLGGAKPGDIPIFQPTVFELLVNLGTAKTLGLTIPPSVLAQADEVIE